MKLAVLDFETYYAEDYTLNKMTTEEYVRDQRYKTHCVGIKSMDSIPAPDQPALPTMTMDHAGFERIKHKVKDYAVVCQNAAFDGLVLSQQYGVTPAFWFDTLSMARLVFPHDRSHSLESLAAKFNLPPKTVPYNRFRGVRDVNSIPGLYNELAAGCAHDVELTYIIFRNLLPMVPKQDLKIIDWAIRTFTEPALKLDRPKAEAYLAKLQHDKQTTLAQLGVSKKDLGSSEKFAALLRSLDIDPPTKPSPKHPEKIIYAFAKTDDGMKDLLDDQDPRVAALASARLGVKSTINETRLQRMLDMDARGALCIYYKAFGAHTRRLAGGEDMNWQNLPRAGETRGCIMAPDGYVLGVADQSQIECRLLNWLAGERWVLDAFADGRDLYSDNAGRFYNRQITRADKVERHLGKTIELGCGYGMGAPKFKLTCKRGALGGPSIMLSDDQAKAAISLYRTTHPNVVRLWKDGNNLLSALFNNGYLQYGPLTIRNRCVFEPGGSWLDYNNLTFEGTNDRGQPEYAMLTRKGKTKIYDAKFIENVIQWLAGVIIRANMLEINPRYRIVLQTHDEVGSLIPVNEAEAGLNFMLGVLKKPPLWCSDCPLDAEGSYAVRYAK